MKTKLLGLMVLVSLVGLLPARATTFTYDVDIALEPTSTLTGNIVLNCDSCDVTSSTLVSWSLTLTDSIDVPSRSFTASGSSAAFGATPDLTASSSALTFTPTLDTFTYFSDPSVGCIAFDANTFTCSPGDDYSLIEAFNLTVSYGNYTYSPSTLIIATLAPTPLPSALPLFSTVVGLAGLLGWRRKRKAAAIAAA